MECTFCGEELDIEEEECPQYDNEGDVICDNCYRENFLFTCVYCQDYGLLENRGDIGSLFASTSEEDTDLQNGIYEIIDHPFYISDMFSMRILEDSVKLISTDISKIHTRGYPIGFLCEECSQKIKESANELQCKKSR